MITPQKPSIVCWVSHVYSVLLPCLRHEGCHLVDQAKLTTLVL